MSTQELTASDPAAVGPYRLLRRLGSGGMGVVYLADSPGSEPVAVKCLPFGVNGEVRGRLRREAEFLSAVRHPRVAAFVDADTRAERPWIAMQYIAGPSLAQASVPLGPAQLRHLCEGLAEALAALHRQGLTHRDVKPGNIILTHGGPVLVDLGIAAGSDLTALTAVGMVVGTPEWMAPEQLVGGSGGHATDLWGWAAVATYAATGRTPFGGGAIDALAYRIRHEAPDLRGVPDWLHGALTAALAKDPRSRPTAAQLAAVDGIRTIGSAARARATSAAALVPAGGVVRTSAPRVQAPPAVRPPAPVVRPVEPPLPSPREQARARAAVAEREKAAQKVAQKAAAEREKAAHKAAQKAAAEREKAAQAAQKAARQRPRRVEPLPPPAPRPRRSFGHRLLRRLLRRLLLWLVLLALALAVALVAYAWVAQAVRGTPWQDTLRGVRTSVSNLLT